MTVSMRSFSEVLHSPHLPIKEVALKEWAVCIEALGRGEQMILVRKGGIMEETREFRVEEASFYLYPTYEHQRADLVKPAFRDELKQLADGVEVPPKEVTIRFAAHVVDDIAISEEKALALLDSHHILTHDYATERLRWQAEKPLHILVVRVYKLSVPVTVPVHDEYMGCKSWLTLKTPFENLDLEPVLSDEAFQENREAIWDALGVKHPHA